MKRALTIVVLALVVVVAAFAYLHHRQVVKQRQEFDAFSPPVAPHAAPANSLPAPANAPSLVQQLPANASAVVFTDVAALRSSSFANELASLAPTSVQDPAYTQFVQETGFDYSRDLDRAALALWPQTAATSALALAQGRFDQAKIAHCALRNGGHLVIIHNQKVYEVREENSARLVRFTFLAPDEIALADGPALSQVLGPQNSVRLDQQMSALVSRVSEAPIYAVARTQDLPKDIGIDASHSAQLASALRTIHTVFASGRPSADDLKLFASADCGSTIDALKLSTALQGLLWMGRAALADSKTQQQIGPEWAGFDAMLKAADISHDGHLLQLRIQLTPQMLQALMTPPPNAAAGAGK
jgi:hypothetical protein